MTHFFSDLDYHTKNRKRVNSLLRFADEKQGKSGDFPQSGEGVFGGSGLVDEGQEMTVMGVMILRCSKLLIERSTNLGPPSLGWWNA